MKRVVISLLAVLLLCLASPADARESISSLAKKLLTHDDFRVRTSAALALGSTANKNAVKPLCKGLNDGKSTVRAASAAALGKLALGGKSCLKTRLGKEGKSNVKKMIKKSIRKIDNALNGPKLNKSTRFYIAVGKVNGDKNKVRSAMKRNLASRDGYAIAPDGESSADAKKRLRKYPDVQGYYFEPTLTVKKSGDSVEVTFSMTIYDYPKSSELGSASRTLGQSGVDGDPDELENELIRKCTDRVMDKFAEMAEDV
jgi:hypothetical protein